jgi:hypothetical protein
MNDGPEDGPEGRTEDGTEYGRTQMKDIDTSTMHNGAWRRLMGYMGIAICACLPWTAPLAAHNHDGDRDHDRDRDRGHGHDPRIEPPAVPFDLIVGAEFRPFLLAHATGTQNYLCLAAAGGAAWSFIGPQATLFDDRGRQVATHFLSANPDENGIARATWQDSEDTSRVWALSTKMSSDPAFVEAGAIPWLRLDVTGKARGPHGGDALLDAELLQRVNTSGGLIPATGCAQAADIGKRAFVPYTADYVFYEKRGPRR